MTLREELEDRADKLDAELLDLSGRIKEIERQSNELHTCLNALDIAEMDAEDEAREWAEAESLPVTDEQPELFAAEKEVAREQLEREPEIHAGFTEWDGGECPLPVGTRFDMICRACGPWYDMEVLADSTLEWQHTGRDLDIVAYRVIEASPAPDPDEQDDASEFAEPMPDPEFVVLDEQTCEPVEEAPALNADMQDEREQPVTDVAALIASGEHSYDEVAAIAYPEPDGYAPVTNPEADALAKAHDWYDPKAVHDRNRFNPWGGVAHLFGKPKVDA